MKFDMMSAKELYSEEVICGLMDEPDEQDRRRMYYALLDRASEFGTKTVKRVEEMYKLAEKDFKKKEKERLKSDEMFNGNYTDFGGEYPKMKCGRWIADMNGVYNPDALPGDRVACPHPILPAEIITNVEDDTQKVRIAFCRGGRWKEQIVPKIVIANRSRISELAGIGVAVTSETAKSLVKYLAEVEQLNLESIKEVRATAKMGWCEDGYMPYSSALKFDKDGRFDTLFSTVKSAGSRRKWMDFVLKLRADGRKEPRIAIAASLASVLIKPCGLLPFWVDIWGKSGGGKSICGMLAASVWADPEIGKYVSKFDSTISAFEARAGFLNNLPFVIDDTAEIRRRLKDDFSQLIYQLASGEGRDRSNTRLGLANKTTWANVIICSGETPIINEQLQGGAINRVLEYETDDGDIFPDGQGAAALLRANYGFIGSEFVEVLKNIGLESIILRQQRCFNAIRHNDYEDKQLRSLSALLIADEIADEHIFKDGKRLTFEETEKLLTDKKTLSENERCYEYLLNECSINYTRFTTNNYGDFAGEIWGRFIHNPENGKEYVAIAANTARKLCASGGFALKPFISWADRKGILWKGNSGTPTRQVAITGETKPKCYVLEVPSEEIE